MSSLQTHVHNNTIHTSQEVEATQMSIVGWMNKLSVVYAYSGILFSLKKGNLVTWPNIDEPLQITLDTLLQFF